MRVLLDEKICAAEEQFHAVVASNKMADVTRRLSGIRITVQQKSRLVVSTCSLSTPTRST